MPLGIFINYLISIDDNPLFIDIFETTIAYVLERNLKKVFALDVGGGLDKDGEVIGDMNKHVNCMAKPEMFSH